MSACPALINLHRVLKALAPCLQSIPEPELSRESREAFDVAYNNIRRFHEAQLSQPLEVETMPGVRCRRVTRPIGEPSCHHFFPAFASNTIYAGDVKRRRREQSKTSAYLCGLAYVPALMLHNRSESTLV